MSKQQKQSNQAAGARTAYTQEFHDEAARLTVNSGKSVAQVARDLGSKVATLHTWRRHARYDHRLPVADNETTEQQLKRLQKEVELLKQEHGFLKKPMTYFAQPPQK